MQVEKVAIASLVYDPANARKHDTKNLEAIKGSLARFGQQKVIVVDKDNVVVAGNGTLEAAKQLGWTEIEIHRTKLTGTDRAAFAVADNRAGELAAWDDDVLSKTLESLKLDGFDLSLIGFDNADLIDLGLVNPDFSAAGIEEQGKLDEKKKIQCPECGHEFTT